ncbi:MAG: hypothetical protein QM765_28420 [Myxococcales bacterium]
MLRLCAVVVLVTLAGCAHGPGWCELAKDCEGPGDLQVCVKNQCRECADDSDCRAGMKCETNKCVSAQ